MIAFDSSALVKLVIREHESAALRAWIASQEDDVWVASDLCRVEVVRAVARAEPASVAAAAELLTSLDLVPLGQTLLAEAAALPPPSLRSLDAIHLATAATLGRELTSFVVYDDRLAQAATDAGLPVVEPR